MQIYRIIVTDGEPGQYYNGAVKASKVAKEMSLNGDEVSVYSFSTPKLKVDINTFVAALNEEPWCEPVLIAQFQNGKAKKV